MFVGRTAELAGLATELATAASGHARVVVVTAPAGGGSSSLLRAFLSGPAQDAVAVAAEGEEAEALLPLGLLDQLLRRLGDDRSPVGEDPLAAGARLLARLDRRCAHAGRAPMVVAVDDAQWADAASLGALTFAARRLEAISILLVVAAWEDEGPRLAGLLRQADDRGRRIRLPGLSAQEISLLAGAVLHGPLSPAMAERIRRHTDGRPLAVTALLEEVGEQLLADPPGPLPAPRAYAMLVLRRLAACPEETRRLVVAAAALGVRSPLRAVAELARLEDPLPALSDAVRAGLLELSSDAREVVFAPALARAVVYPWGCGSVRRAGPGRASVLTPQESAVAQLVADGMTNRQIATELVVSVKTVEYHLGHVFAKLGVQSRAQLAARLARAEVG